MTIDSETGVIVWKPTVIQRSESNSIYLASGVYNVLVRVQDNLGGVDLQSFQVKLTPVNNLPAFTNSSPTFIQPQRGKLFEYRLNALDADGDAEIRYELVNPPTGATLNPDTGILRWTPSQTGEFQFTVKAIDSLGGEASQTITATVVEPRPNTPPEITATPRSSVRIGSTYLYQLPLTDSDGDPLTFNFLQSPAGMELDSQGRIIWTPTPSQFGSHPISLEVNDGEDTTTLSWTLNVSNQTVNRAPSITSTPNLITNLERVYQYQLVGFDPDGDLLLWTLDKAPSGMVIDPNSGMLSWQPNATQIGEHTIAIRVTDATGHFVGQEFDLTVRGINTPPEIVSVPITAAAVGTDYRYQIASTDLENDGGRYSLGIAPDGMQIDPETGLITWTPTAQQSGSVEVEVLVIDGQNGVNRQTYTIEVGSDAINHPPVITSTAKYFAATGVPYRYQIEATDADNDGLIYQPISVPNGMTLDVNTGELRWDSPTFGTHQVVVGVNDGRLGAAQGFTLTVQNDLPPVFNTNEPPTVAIPNRLFSYDIQATDPNGSSLTYRLDDASIALGMSVDELGRLRWIPTVENVGTHAITIEAIDELGTTATQTFNLTVTADNVAPQIQLLPSNVYLVDDDYRADIGSEITFFLQATDNVGITGMQLFINDEPVELSGLGTAKIKIEEFGNIKVRAVAYDAAFNVTESTLEITAIDSSDPDSPVVALAEGLFDETVTASLEIVGTVEDENLDYYTLEVAAGGSSEFREIFRGTESVVDGVLGTFDPSILQNDSYVLRLSAYDKGGNGSTIEERIEVGGEKQGNLNLSFNDLVEIPITGFPIILTRTYDSLNAEDSDDFGYGWRMELVDTDLRTNVPPPSFEQELLDIQNAFTDDTRVYVTLPDGERIDFRFEPTGDRLNSFLSLYGDGAARWYHPTFVADNGSGMTLSVPDTRLILGPDGNYYDLAGVPYNPENSRFGGQYTLTTPEGVVAEIDAKSGDLLKVTDADGYSLTFSDAGIFSSTGEAIALGRDAKGRINTVTDFNNQVIRYQYDEKGDLVAVTDRDNVTTHFDYHQSFDHYLTSVLDPLGRSGANAFYDENGRLQLLLQDGTDLLTNQAPILINDSVLVSANLPATIDLSSLVTDPDGDRVTYHISNALNGTAELLADGTTLSFQPAPDFVGTASFDLVANDGGVRSVNETITVKVSDAPLLSLDVVERDVQLRSDGTTNLVVTANFADRKGVVIPASELTYSTDNPDLVTVESDGTITAKNAEGVAVVRVSYRDEEAVTAIRIGATPTPTNDAEFNVALAEFEGIDPYPDAITLVPGAKRQLQLRLNSLSDSPDLSAAASGTRYYVSDENVVRISEDGKITALSSGYATVTVVHGAAEETIEVRVVEPISGTASIGVNGGAVRSDDGAMVMVPPGALTEETPVSIGQIEESNLSLEIPEKFSFAGSFNLDIGEQPLEFPLQFAIPAPAGVEPGTEVFFLRKGELPALQQGDKWVGSETMHPIWTMVESGIVGDDGMIYTTSPPWRGAYESGEYSIAIPKFDYSVAHLRLAGFSAGVGLGLIAVGGIALAYPKLSPLTYSRPDYFVPGGLIGAGALALASVPVLLDASERSVTTLTIPTVGLPYTTELNVSLNLCLMCQLNPYPILNPFWNGSNFSMTNNKDECCI
ncbi:putative Ig domain-containing protein [Oxynema aestuarii]|uniref:Dystroglycan-type cadherin-like domain-containing protein n=1 Tax=Oxynema aestuarii AP17 TaxID=2064643 RepID=A0A6H1U5X4_9CYAN|nr:putative Ig domain-containing protein [Oxynema aestuarii]QIZ73029.1 hypothetical protein HCG48_22500 [Oxynema aestuarii AP17]